MTDLEIARAAQPRALSEAAARIGIPADALEYYGKNKAKLPLELLQPDREKQANLVLVTAISPTPAGEGKTTVTVGLTDGLAHIGLKSAAALREPSLGPVFGIKGGATGGGHSQVIPMEDINLHFTGDFSAVEKANNLLAALIDNNLQSKKRSLRLDPRTISWKRVMDMNDRALRQIVLGLGGKNGGVPRESGFNITAASEIMAILCQSQSLEDLKERMGRIYVGDTWDREPVYASMLNAHDAMTLLMKDAIRPNLVQTLEGNPAILHGGPFANIAQGTNTLLATRMALSHADWVVTEAGFGADLGAEKFMHIKARAAGLRPRAAVLVATVRALQYHGRGDLAAGLPNLEKHAENLLSLGLPVVVALNAFAQDNPADYDLVRAACEKLGVGFAVSRAWAQGGAGAADLARAVVDAGQAPEKPVNWLYELDAPLKSKIENIATRWYGAADVAYTPLASAQLDRLTALGMGSFPICMAKTQKSLSDDETLLGRPTGFTLTVREVEVAAGAGFVVPITGAMMRMPGLPEVPAAEGMTVAADGTVQGLF
jgi:formate--tetrahydrofolate ligase